MENFEEDFQETPKQIYSSKESTQFIVQIQIEYNWLKVRTNIYKS